MVRTPSDATAPSMPPCPTFASATSGRDRDLLRRGRQAIAALCWAPPSRVQRSGPANAYVVAGQAVVVRSRRRGSAPGPDEVLVLWTTPRILASSLRSARGGGEHGSGHERVWLVTTSARTRRRSEKETARQLPKQARREFDQRILGMPTPVDPGEATRRRSFLREPPAPEHR